PGTAHLVRNSATERAGCRGTHYTGTRQPARRYRFVNGAAEPPSACGAPRPRTVAGTLWARGGILAAGAECSRVSASVPAKPPDPKGTSHALHHRTGSAAWRTDCC